MAKNKKETEYEYKYKKDFQEDWEIHRNYIVNFDAYEAMLQGLVYDSVSKSVDGAKITDSYAMTLAKERADRVIAKLPEGSTESAGKADVGKAVFMDIVRQKWIFPNANAQHPFLEKLNMWQLYSSVYGYMPMFYDWNVAATGYVGPDCWLWNPRNLVPQQGRTSIEDMEYVTALTWVSKKKLEQMLKSATDGDGWDKDALKLLIEIADNEITDADTEKDTLVERERISTGTKRGVCLATRYEAGDDGNWCTFAPDHGCVQIRELPNPHKNGRIPFVIKYSQPLFDSFYGLGDFQRAKPLQFARDGLTNFYFASLKRNLSPGLIVNSNGVLKHTLDITAPNPILMETIPNSIRPVPTNTAGLSTYQGAMSNLTGSLLSLYGTQNASLPGAESLNPSQGKTPAAIDMFSEKEATRDGAERRHMETAIEQLTDGFFSLIANIGTETIPVSLFAKDIEEIAQNMGDVLDLFKDVRIDETGLAGDLTIDPAVLKGIEYRFNTEPNSTMKINKQKQLEELERYVDNMGKFQNLFKDDPRVEFHPDKISAAFGRLADIKGANEFVTVKPGPSPEELALMEENQQLQQENQQMQMQLQQTEGQLQQEQAKAQQAATTLQEPAQPEPMMPEMDERDKITQAAQEIMSL